MAISTGAAMLIGTAASAGLGGASSRASTKAGKQALAEQIREFDLAREDLAPYREVGTAALGELAAALGIEGYRTAEERAYTEYLRTKPSGAADPSPYLPSGVGGTLVRTERMSTMGDLFGGVTKYIDKKKKKAQAAADFVAKKRLAEWQKEADRLKAASDASLIGYDPVAATLAKLSADPGYGFRLSEGEKALERSQAATTGVLGGRAVKEGLRYNQDYSSNEYTNYINRLAAAAGIGQATSTTSAGIAAGAGPANAAQINLIGSSKAGAYQYANQAIQGGLSNYLTMSMYDQLLKGNTGGANAA